MMKYFGFILAFVIFLADRLSKWWVVEIYDLKVNGPLKIFPFLNFSYVENTGISLGLFQMEGEAGRFFLIALTGIISLVIFFWLLKATENALKIGLGLVLGGALGNIWDRFEYKWVVDFIQFHIEDWSFYIFNVADAAITIGVVILLWDALLSPQKKNT